MKAFAVMAVVVLAGTACGSVSAGSKGSSGYLVVTQRFDRSAGSYIEGSYSYIRVTEGGRPVLEERITDRPLGRRLPAGSYTLDSYQRPCDGNCGHLDAPLDECSAPLRLFVGDMVRAEIVVRPGKGCAISFG